jgi:N-acetylglucosamine-6-sulfatase
MAACVAAVVAWGGSRAAAGTPEPTPTNVIVVMTDDMTTSQLRFMSQTRHLLRAKGTKYSRHFAVQPLCCPSRATFLTGQYPHNHGVQGNGPPLGGYEGLPANTLNQWVQDADYRTAWIGKFLNGYGTRENPPQEVPPGWDKWIAPVGKPSYFDYTLNVNGELRPFGSDRADYLTDVLAKRAAHTIKGTDQPLFMVVAPSAPHNDSSSTHATPARRHRGTFAGSPLPSKRAFQDDLSDKPEWVSQAGANADPRLTRKRWRRASESLLAVDELVLRLVDAVRSRGELGRTVLVFTSDNGTMYGEHSLNKKNVPYEPSISVPLLIRGPGFTKGGTDTRLTGNVDLAPTIVALTGAEPEITMDGRSLLSADARDQLLIEGGKGEALPPVWSGLRSEESMYAEYGTGDAELYDMSADPEQLTNVAGEPGYTGLRTQLAAALATVRDCAGAQCP